MIIRNQAHAFLQLGRPDFFSTDSLSNCTAVERYCRQRLHPARVTNPSRPARSSFAEVVARHQAFTELRLCGVPVFGVGGFY